MKKTSLKRKTPLKAKKKTLNKSGKTDYQKAKNKLDKVFSQYIRLRDSDKHGLATCCTCGAKRPWKEMDAGHFYNRNNLSVRWDETNVHVQCKRCNRFMSGRTGEYAAFMRRTYPENDIQALEYAAGRTTRWTTFDLEQLVKHYKEETKNIKEE